jgi:hypothetical protein
MEIGSITGDDFLGSCSYAVESHLGKIWERFLLICVGFHRFSWSSPFLFVRSGRRSQFVVPLRSQLGVGIGRSRPCRSLAAESGMEPSGDDRCRRRLAGSCSSLHTLPPCPLFFFAFVGLLWSGSEQSSTAACALGGLLAEPDPSTEQCSSVGLPQFLGCS